MSTDNDETGLQTVIPRDHLRACHEHGVVAERNAPCPCCQTNIEARPGGFNGYTSSEDLRWHIEPDTMLELLPLVEEFVDDEGLEAWVAVAELDKKQLPAGYTQQERWYNVVCISGTVSVKYLMHDSQARETIENLRDAGYGGDRDE